MIWICMHINKLLRELLLRLLVFLHLQVILIRIFSSAQRHPAIRFTTLPVRCCLPFRNQHLMMSQLTSLNV
uniref:Uncharacterized protein n=1 Tax=Picea sitchensis TaxID=3332 RepID=A9NKJ2_PICSI|nr:unknown [Picea sitchensis]